MPRARIFTALLAALLAVGLAVTILWLGAAGATDYVRANVLLSHRDHRRRGRTDDGEPGTALAPMEFSRQAGRRARSDARKRPVVFRDASGHRDAVLRRRTGARLPAERAHAGRTERRDVGMDRGTGDRCRHARRLPASRAGVPGWAAVALAGWIAALVLVGGRAAPATAGAEFQRPSVIGVLLLSSVTAWLLPIAALWWSLAALDSPVTPAAAADAMAAGTLIGAVVGVPLGTGVTGSAAIVVLERYAVAPATAAAAVAAFRAGTTRYAVALGLCVLLLHRRRLVAFLGPGLSSDHFSAIAAEYQDQIPAHIRDRLLNRKIAFMERHLASAQTGAALRGLDVGCGQGWYAIELSARGYDIDAVDAAEGQIAHAVRVGQASGSRARFQAADAESCRGRTRRSTSCTA